MNKAETLFRRDEVRSTLLLRQHPSNGNIGGAQYYDLTYNPHYTNGSELTCMPSDTKFPVSDEMVSELLSCLRHAPTTEDDHIMGMDIPLHLLFQGQYIRQIAQTVLPSLLKLATREGFNMNELIHEDVAPVEVESRQYFDPKGTGYGYLRFFFDTILAHTKKLQHFINKTQLSSRKQAVRYAKKRVELNKDKEGGASSSVVYCGQVSQQSWLERMAQEDHPTKEDGAKVNWHLSKCFCGPSSMFPAASVEENDEHSSLVVESFLGAVLVGATNRTLAGQGKAPITGRSVDASSLNVARCGYFTPEFEDTSSWKLWLIQNCRGANRYESILSERIPRSVRSYAEEFKFELFKIFDKDELVQIKVWMVQRMMASHGGKKRIAMDGFNERNQSKVAVSMGGKGGSANTDKQNASRNANLPKSRGGLAQSEKTQENKNNKVLAAKEDYATVTCRHCGNNYLFLWSDYEKRCTYYMKGGKRYCYSTFKPCGGKDIGCEECRNRQIREGGPWKVEKVVVDNNGGESCEDVIT